MTPIYTIPRSHALRALPSEWEAAWQGIGAHTVPPCAPILALYDYPRRAYHNLSHIAQTITAAHALCNAGMLSRNERARVVLALLFHDVVQGPEGEKLSAILFRQYADGLGAGYVLDVAWAIEATTHTADRIPDDVRGKEERERLCVILNADLSILASSPARFRAYRAAIRQEHADLSADSFQDRTRAWARRMLNRPTIYHPGAPAEWEKRARANLTKLCESLSRSARHASATE